MPHRGLVLAAALIVAATLAGCSSKLSRAPDMAPGEEPAITSDEAGLWLRMGRAETSLKTSGRLVNDPELVEYLQGIVCRVAAAHCRDVRVYVASVPEFNASMAPNGMMVIWTGTLLRAENEAQLAFVLSHELSHYLRRHSLQMIQDLTATTDAVAFASVLTGGTVGVVASIAGAASVSSFSRDMEREADTKGLELVAAAGYDPRQAALLWERLIEEREAGDEDTASAFFATHPGLKERVASLRSQAEGLGASGGRTAEQSYNTVLGPRLAHYLRDEVGKRDFQRTRVVLRQLVARGRNLGQVYFALGEVDRQERADGFEGRAIESYEAALRYPDAPAETHRSLGLIYWGQGRTGRAAAAFRSYLAARPDADDRAIVESYLTELAGGTS